MKALSIIIIIFITVIMFVVFPAHASESSPSADIRAKLEELKKAIASKAAKLKQEVNRKLQNKAYVGKVKSKSANTLTLKTKTGSKTVSINQDTIFESKIKSKQKFSQTTISEENYIAGLGDVDETASLTARKVILLPTPNSKQHATPSGSKTYLWGQVVSISDDLITLKGKDSTNVAVSPSTDAKVKVLDLVILTGNFGKNDIFEAGFVYIIPQSGILKPKKATSSAQVSTPPARPKEVKR